MNQFILAWYTRVIFFLLTEDFLSCSINSLKPCSKNQICNGTTSKCDCDIDFVKEGTECVKFLDEVPAYHRGTIAVTAIFSVALLLFGFILIAKKYKLLDYVRDKINYRRTNEVMYEDVMIGQDDPPINP